MKWYITESRISLEILKQQFFKLGTRNVHHEINKMTLVVLLPWQRFCRWSCTVQIRIESLTFCLNQVSSTPRNLMRRVYTILEPCLFQTGPPVTHKGLQIGYLDFDEKRLELRELPWQGHHFVSFVMYISGAKFEDHCANLSRDILDSVFYHFSYTVNYVIAFLICIIQKR